MTISTFEIFSVGIGPSSSHTVGPMRAAKDFIDNLNHRLNQIQRIKITLFGSLAYTGEGHGTDSAILMGLLGETPEKVDPDSIIPRKEAIKTQQKLALLEKHTIPFILENDLEYDFKKLFEFHSNAMCFIAYDQNEQKIHKEVYYSIGGGFIVKESEREHLTEQTPPVMMYPFQTAGQLLSHCEANQLSISEVMLANEQTWHDEQTVRKKLLHIADIMGECIEKGIRSPGILPGKLKVKRRAPPLYEKLIQQGKPQPMHPEVMRWLNCFALAVNEENAAGGRIVTAPTNGGSGTLPAVLYYYKYFCSNATDQGVIDLLLTAAAIGILYKKNASISGAEMGCQGEVGVACSMAAGGLAAALGGTIYQVENAAEIGMEHNLGMTCDPVAGLVQIPCIERNAMAAVKAVNAAQLALAESGEHKVSLDMVINTMREIGTNMNSMYKETSKGGLAVNVPEC